MRALVICGVVAVIFAGGLTDSAAAQDSLAAPRDSLITTQESGARSVDADLSLRDSLAAGLAALPNSPLGHLQAVDLRLFYRIYTLDQPAFDRFAAFGNVTANPTFYGSVPVTLSSSFIAGSSAAPAVRLAVSEVAAYLLSIQLKNVVERFRPVRHIDLLSSGNPSSENIKSYGFPSGHAAVASALVTSWSLSYPEWYVIAPGSIWVVSVGVSRIWKGRHYPGDVVAGILLGAAVGLVVDELSP